MNFQTYVPSFSRSGSSGWTLMVALLLGASCSSPAQQLQPVRSVIGLEQVIAALAAAKLPLESAEVSLLAQNIATVAEPRLEVRRLEPLGEQSARVRMGCAIHEQCLPFYVAVRWNDASLAKAALHCLDGGTSRTGSGARDAQTPVQPASSWNAGALSSASFGDASLVASPSHEPAQAASQECVRAGSHATLLIDAERLHIKVPVICLEKGSPGRRIRVAALDHKQTYLAEVVDATFLKGSL